MKVSTSWSLSVALALAATGSAFAAPKPAAAAAKPAKPAPVKAAPKPAAKPATAAPAAAKLPAGVVATVNGEPITKTEISDRLWREVGPNMVQDEINKTIVQLEAKKRGITVDPKAVQQRMQLDEQQYTSRPGQTAGDWNKLMARVGKKNYEDQVKFRMLLDKIGEDEASKTKLSPAEEKQVVDGLEANAHQVHAEHILIGVGSRFNNRSDEDAQKRAQEALAKLNSGAKWEDVAKEYSDDTVNKDNGGDLGFFSRGQMVKEFEDAAFSMKPGEITKQPVKTQFGYHIIKVVDVKDQPVTQADKQKAIDEALTNKKNQAKMPQVWFNTVRAKYTVQNTMPAE